jgi:DeoR family fructose operon transcriptional repressor
MIPYVRRKKLIEYLENQEIAYIADLAIHANTSEATIRRDLKSLEEEGRIEILQGGAAKLLQYEREKSANERMSYKKEEKRKLGEYGATLVSHGEFIFIGPGTTENWMLKHLVGKEVTVVTNGIVHIEKLLNLNIDTTLIGGKLNRKDGLVSCETAMEQIKNLNFDKCFLGSLGISEAKGASTSSSALASLNKEVMKRSKKSILLVDSTKLGKTARYKFAEADDFDVILCLGDVYSEFEKRDNVTNIEPNN